LPDAAVEQQPDAATAEGNNNLDTAAAATSAEDNKQQQQQQQQQQKLQPEQDQQQQQRSPVSRDSLLKETEHCRVWWDAKGERQVKSDVHVCIAPCVTKVDLSP
jgi:hypothetical protein